MTEPFFNADHIQIGQCDRPGCHAVHIQLFDAGGVMRAQAVIGCDSVDAIAAELQVVRSRVLGSYTSLGLH